MIDRVLNVLVIVLAIVILMPTARSAKGAWDRHRDEVLLKETIQSYWDELTGEGDTLHYNAIDRPTVVEFSDYECPYCRTAHQILSSEPGADSNGSIVFRHLPLSIHANAEGAARASLCASKGGRFQQMHRALFETSDWFAGAQWVRLAGEAGLDTAEFISCLESEEIDDRLRRDRELAQVLGIRGTPAFVSKDGIVYGVRDRSTSAGGRR